METKRLQQRVTTMVVALFKNEVVLEKRKTMQNPIFASANDKIAVSL